MSVASSEWVQISEAPRIGLPEMLAETAWRKGDLTAIVSLDGGKWHLSIAHPTRYPTWDEIKEVRYRFLPDELYMAIILPPKREYVNVHQRGTGGPKEAVDNGAS